MVSLNWAIGTVAHILRNYEGLIWSSKTGRARRKPTLQENPARDSKRQRTTFVRGFFLRNYWTLYKEKFTYVDQIVVK
jgi:hypothetical protein